MEFILVMSCIFSGVLLESERENNTFMLSLTIASSLWRCENKSWALWYRWELAITNCWFSLE